MKQRISKQTKQAVKPNTNSQSYQHMQGQLNDPKDHPAYSLPDPVGSAMGSANAPSAPMQDMAEAGY